MLIAELCLQWNTVAMPMRYTHSEPRMRSARSTATLEAEKRERTQSKFSSTAYRKPYSVTGWRGSICDEHRSARFNASAISVKSTTLTVVVQRQVAGAMSFRISYHAKLEASWKRRLHHPVRGRR